MRPTVKHNYDGTSVKSIPELLVDVLLLSFDSHNVDWIVVFFNCKVFLIRWLYELYLIVLSVVESIEIESRDSSCDQSFSVHV